MKKNKKDYLTKTLILQFSVCLILFGLLFALKSSNNTFYKEVKNLFSDRLEDNISFDEVQSVFANIKQKTSENKEENTTESETEYIPPEEPSLSAQIIASGGNDKKVSSAEEIPDNVSRDDYELSQKMILPVKGTVSSEFGTRIHPISGDLRFHAGIDIAADEGTKIHSAFDGEVVKADYDQWNGNFIKIQHENGIMTVYCHCKKLNVKKGQIIRAGEIIGTVGSTGNSTGPHLHFELRINNISYNPEKALNEAKNAA